MKLDYDSILQRADILYGAAKTSHIPQEDLAYWAPERFPKIQSEQVKCMLEALIEAIKDNCAIYS